VLRSPLASGRFSEIGTGLLSINTLRALHVLASLPEDGKLTKGKDLAARLQFPAATLAKLLKALAKGRILNSIRGPNGGFILARPAHRITVREILEALKEPGPLPDCILSRLLCQRAKKPCPLHLPWCQLKNEMEGILATLTVRDFYLMGTIGVDAGQGSLGGPHQVQRGRLGRKGSPGRTRACP